MTDLATRINDDWTVEELLDAFDGAEYRPFDQTKNHFLCDFCSERVPYDSTPTVGQYLADNILNSDHPEWRAAFRASGRRPIVQLASYCEDCTTQLLFLPCEGFSEARLSFTLTADRMISEPQVTDVSGRDDGVPWEPKSLSERITGVPWHKNERLAALTGEHHLWGPENMVTVFLSAGTGIDIRELVRWDGSLDPAALGRARTGYRAFMEKMRRTGHSRNAFKDHVRGDNP